MVHEVAINSQTNHLVTDGLKKYNCRELRICIKQRADEQYSRVLRYIINYVVEKTAAIQPEQTIAYHSWILKFVSSSEQYYDLWEAKDDGNGFMEGVDYALKVLTDQENECSLHAVQPFFPTFGQNIVISKGVYEGVGVYGVRYSSPVHMTGWWLTTEEYDDNIKSLITVPYYKLAFKRPDLIRFLALPFGYRFFAFGQKTDVWFDQDVLKEE